MCLAWDWMWCQSERPQLSRWYVTLLFFRREHHDIPLILQTCVDEVERRGLSEVGIYRVAGVLRDIQELRKAFDTGMVATDCCMHQSLVLSLSSRLPPSSVTSC